MQLQTTSPFKHQHHNCQSVNHLKKYLQAAGTRSFRIQTYQTFAQHRLPKEDQKAKRNIQTVPKSGHLQKAKKLPTSCPPHAGQVESVVMRHEDRTTICVSSQAHSRRCRKEPVVVGYPRIGNKMARSQWKQLNCSKKTLRIYMSLRYFLQKIYTPINRQSTFFFCSFSSRWAAKWVAPSAQLAPYRS